MKRPKIIDSKTNKYVDYLEGKLKDFNLDSQKVKTYLSLKNFVEQSSKLLMNFKVEDNEDNLSDKDDKALDRGLKFGKEIDDLQSLLDKMYAEIGELPEEKGKQEAERDVKVAKYAYKKAYDAGDADKVLSAQEKLTDAKLKLTKLADVDSSLQEEQVPVQSQETAVQVDAKADKWAKDNTWFGSDDEMTAYAMGVHNKIVKEGVDPSSDEYYEKINSRMQATFSDYFGEDGQTEEQETKKRKSNVVAPATRSTSPKKVTLTRTQVAIAKKLGVPLELYAKKVAEEMRKV